MNESENPNSRLNRRDLVKGVAAAGVALTVGIDGIPRTAAAAPAADNRITKENARPGTRDWMLTKTDITDDEPV
ncbi:MAG TPA: twin-arginine translocation signal domain-containing protein, partial [Verrucomicrobia bacterium]|nr:twin-arginine translocation signal domain-containing protein [Verrucomicrobiota bacterium]